MQVDLELLFSRVLTAIAFTAEGRALAMDGDLITGSSSKSRPPTLGADLREDPHPLDALPRAWDKAHSEYAQRQVIEQALAVLRSLRYAPDVSLRRGTLEWRMKIGADNRSPTVLVHVYGISRQSVYNYRREFKDAA
jgi:hypothetical protein